MPPHNDVEAFHEVLRSSRRIMALCGAGLSASSGMPTFRGAGGLWRNYDATQLATMEAFETDPGLVWLFYGYRRHMSLKARPNPAHYALAQLARQNKDFLCLTQNVDSGWPDSYLRGRRMLTPSQTSRNERTTLSSSYVPCTAPCSTSNAPGANGPSAVTLTTLSAKPSRRRRRILPKARRYRSSIRTTASST